MYLNTCINTEGPASFASCATQLKQVRQEEVVFLPSWYLFWSISDWYGCWKTVVNTQSWTGYWFYRPFSLRLIVTVYVPPVGNDCCFTSGWAHPTEPTLTTQSTSLINCWYIPVRKIKRWNSPQADHCMLWVVLWCKIHIFIYTFVSYLFCCILLLVILFHGQLYRSIWLTSTCDRLATKCTKMFALELNWPKKLNCCCLIGYVPPKDVHSSFETNVYRTYTQPSQSSIHHQELWEHSQATLT